MFLGSPKFKSVVLFYKLNHQVSLCQLRLFTTECLFDPILSLSPLSSGLHSSLLLYKDNASKTSLAKMIVLFFLMGIVTKETHQVPVQSLPFPVYPG